MIVMLERMEDWLNALAAVAEPLRAACGEGRHLTIVPAIAGLSAPDQAVSGVDTLFPQSFPDVAWLEALGFPPVDRPLTRIFDTLAAALLEASAIQGFGCAGEGRAPDEMTILAKALDEIESARAELKRQLPAAERTQVINHLDQLRAMGPNLARGFWRHVHGGVESEAVVVLTVLKLMIVDADVAVIECGEPSLR